MPNGSSTHMDLKEMRLLLVDDEEIFQKGLVSALTRKGIVPRQAGSGKECLSILEKEKIDVVVLDSKMPGQGQGRVRYGAGHARGRLYLLFAGRAGNGLHRPRSLSLSHQGPLWALQAGLSGRRDRL